MEERMKKGLFTVLLILSISLFILSCQFDTAGNNEVIEVQKAAYNGPVIVRLGERFKLPEGEQALVPRQRILLTFKEVLWDSRCPKGAVCIWEGEAVILVNVKIGWRDYGDFRMTTHDNPSKIYVDRYFVEFIDLLPYPELDPPTDAKIEYVGYFLIDYAVSVSTPPPWIR